MGTTSKLFVAPPNLTSTELHIIVIRPFEEIEHVAAGAARRQEIQKQAVSTCGRNSTTPSGGD